MRAILIITILLGLMGCNRKDSITQFSETNKMDKQYYVYPSTLRMLNLEKNEEYNEMIKEFRKGQYFAISKTTKNIALLNQLEGDMIQEGYEEAMTFKSKDSDFIVYVLEAKVPKIAAIIEEDSVLSIIQVEGIINVVKLPKLLSSLNNDNYLNLLEVLQIDKNKQDSEHHSQNQ